MAKLTAKQRKWFEYMALMLELHHDNGTRFDLEGWIDPKAQDGEWCGTKGCACGLAALNPTFQAAGVGLPYPGEYRFVYGGLSGWPAVKAFFGINGRQAEYLFYAPSYKGKTYGNEAARKVARRIRSFIASNGKVPKTFKGWYLT